MEPLTLTAATTIISLIGQFKSGRDSKKQSDFNEFLQWLEKNHHDQQIRNILQTQKTAIGIKALINDFINTQVDSNEQLEKLCKEIIDQNNKQEQELELLGEGIADLQIGNDQIYKEIIKSNPVDLIDQHINDELNKICKLRFFGNYQVPSTVLCFSERILNGDLSKGSNLLKCKALAWCARLIARHDLEKTKFLINKSKIIGATDEISIAEAFQFAEENNVDGAIKSLTAQPTPTKLSAALMIKNMSHGQEAAISWKDYAFIKLSDFDVDGKITLIRIFLDLERWEEALAIAQEINDEEYKDHPALLNLVSMAHLINSVPISFRHEVINQIPFRLSPFDFLYDVKSHELRRKSIGLFNSCSEILEKYGNSEAAKISEDYALWIELHDPELSEQAKTRLEIDMDRGGIIALRKFPLAMQVQLQLDLVKIELELNKHTALTGGKIFELALARFTMAIIDKTPHEYIEKNREQIFAFISKPIVFTLEIDSLIKNGETTKLADILIELEQDQSIDEGTYKRLKYQVEVSISEDKLSILINQYKKTNNLGDLINLIDQIETENNFELLDKYAEKLYKEIKSISNAEKIANTKSIIGKMEELSEFLDSIHQLINQSATLQEHYAYSLYNRGRVEKARIMLDEIKQNRTNQNIRSLDVNLAITSGQWGSLVTFVESEWNSRANRTAKELLQAANIAQVVNLSRAKSLVFEAANKDCDNPEVLFAAYMTAVSMGWEHESEVSQWLKEAIALSGDNGPVQSYSLKEVMEKSKEWRDHDSEIWQHFRSEQISAIVFAKLTNKSLCDIFLLPAFANQNETDIRKQTVIPAFSNNRGILHTECKTAALDFTTLYTLGYLGILKLVISEFEKIFIPHSTLLWLFREKEKSKFHQPSIIKESGNIEELILDEKLRLIQPQRIIDVNLALEVGDDLALLLQEASKTVGDNKNKQKLVVIPNAVHKISSLLEKKADLSDYHSILCNCSTVVKKLHEKGIITDEDKETSLIFLKQQGDKDWPNQVVIEDDAVLYLDDLSVKYLQTIGILNKIQGFSVYINYDSKDELKQYRKINEYRQNAESIINEISEILAEGIEQKSIELSNSQGIDHSVQNKESNRLNELFLSSKSADIIVTDERVLNKNIQINFDGPIKQVATSIDVLAKLRREGKISKNELYAFKTKLRQSGYIFIPIDDGELQFFFEGITVINKKIQESAELKSIRENLALIKISNYVKLPNEIQWLNNLFISLINELKLQWSISCNSDTKVAISNWILDLIDFEGWSHFFEGDGGYDLAINGNINLAKALILKLENIKTENDKKIYFQWVEEYVIEPLKIDNPLIYEKFLISIKKLIVNVSKKQLPPEVENK